VETKNLLREYATLKKGKFYEKLVYEFVCLKKVKYIHLGDIL